MPQKVTESTIRESVSAYETHGTKTKAAEFLGIPRGTLNHRLGIAKRMGIQIKEPDKETKEVTQKFEFEEDNKGNGCVVSVGTDITTVDEAIAEAEIDLDLFEVVKTDIKKWHTTVKLRQGGEDHVKQLVNYGITVDVRRKAPKFVQQGIRDLLDGYKPPKLAAVKRKKARNPCLMEIAIFDAHFGKRCWAQEVGHDYDLDIAEKIYLEAANDLIDKAIGRDIEKFVIPLGNDFFQVNNWRGTTEKGTIVASVDDRFQHVFRVGCSAVTQMIERCRQIADVDVLWVPGNHDPETSWYMCEWLDARFSGDKRVKFDNSPPPRKYYHYYRSLIGYTHGDKEQLKTLPQVLERESAKYDDIVTREFHIGHKHKSKETAYLFLSEERGVKIITIPSISGTDSWHYQHNYVNNTRAAEGRVYSRSRGFEDMFNSPVQV